MACTSATEQLFDHLVRCETRLYNALGERLKAEHGIVASQFEFLSYVERHPRCRVADIATTFAIGIGATSKGIDRLEARGWVRRVPHPADRRSSLIELTSAGRNLVTAAERTFREQLETLLAPAITEEQAGALVPVFAALRQALEQRNAGLPTG
ncbi:MarR family winged helix-turn-helix transcriptional regulator [Amycolatopsis australiensis]|uniref:DNA-binding transcriptional regulator, MarR family n=1 Tax=Amycolatopsis australiensis TaxID=546364 RepID=A0A1K1RIS7_9PSEU|nr:MarR family winged helix-turn-helix transcriptional regulator [Amycolatopsis australiensis]SFW72079.1 DNA-binding transcriptional regulator, MarR family [Amycolatopsis australiensis]